MLSAVDLERVHAASLEILESIGMVIEHETAEDILEAAGAVVDRQSHVVRFPPDLVEAKLSLLPKRIEYRGRTAEFDVVCGLEGEILSAVGGGSSGCIDLSTGRPRPARLDDLREFAILGDALPNMHMAGAHTCVDVPAVTSDLHCLRVLLETQRLPISASAFNSGNLRTMIEMVLTVQGSRQELASRPLMYLVLSPQSPLFLARDDAAQLLLACEYGIPILPAPVPSAGTTGPITLAGTIAQGNAEWLALVTLVESVRPGHAVAYGFDPVVADMRTGSAQFATPEAGLFLVAIAQLGSELYGLPAHVNGLCSDGFGRSQTLFEKAQNLLFASLAGGKMMVGAGEVEGVRSFDPVQLVIDDELVAVARRWARGIVVDDDTLAVDVLARVGPRGHFLAEDHTVAHLRLGEPLHSALFERSSRESWAAGEAKTLVQAARERAQQILATHHVPPLPEDVTKELHAIVKKADEELAAT